MGGGDGAWARKKMSHFGTTTIVVAAFIQFPLYGHPSYDMFMAGEANNKKRKAPMQMLEVKTLPSMLHLLRHFKRPILITVSTAVIAATT